MADISIQDAYQQVLGRAPSADEIKYWQSTFGSSVDPVELSTFSVAAQPERAAAPNTNDAVRQMYQQVLGRAPDASGLQYFADRFGTSVDPTELGIFKSMAAQEIAANAARNAGTDPGNAGGDPAAGSYSGGTTTTAGTTVGTGTTGTTAGTTRTGTTAGTGMSITQAYQQVLGRTPSADEIKYWQKQFGDDVDATELSTFSVAAQPERAAAPTTNNAVRQMYLSVLGREPDASGLKYFSDRFGADVDASELGIFRGMSTQEINANAARNAGTTTNTAGTTTGTVQPITRPTTPRQVTGTQLAPAGVTNTAITGTPYTNIYTPATMQQNAPTLAQINAASQSANPYQSLMALTPQRALSPAYAGMLGQTTANTNLGGFDPKIYNPAATPVTGLLNTTTGGNDGSQNGAGGGGGGGQTLAGTVANLSGEAQRAGFNTIGNFLGGFVPVGAEYNKIDPVTGLPAKGSVTAADLAALTGKFDIGSSVSLGGTGDGGGGYGSGSEPGGSGTGAGGYGPQYRGGLITPRDVKGPNPPGPDDGHASLDIGEYVIRKSAVKKYGSNIFEQINAGRIPAQRLKSLLE